MTYHMNWTEKCMYSAAFGQDILYMSVRLLQLKLWFKSIYFLIFPLHELFILESWVYS